MTSFNKIFSRQFAEIDVTKPAFHTLQDETIINKDFFAYSIINSFTDSGYAEVKYDISFLCHMPVFA